MKISVLFSVESPAGKTASESDLMSGDNASFYFLFLFSAFYLRFRFDFNVEANSVLFKMNGNFKKNKKQTGQCDRIYTVFIWMAKNIRELN